MFSGAPLNSYQARARRELMRPVEGHWQITERAAREYAALVGRSSLAEARAELEALSVRARPVRRQANGLELWRVRIADGRRIRLLVGEPPGHPGGKPILVQVLRGD